MKKISIFLGLITRIERLILRMEQRTGGSGNNLRVNTDVIRRVEKWILENRWNEDKSMQEVARDMGISHEQLSLYFRLFWGKAFLQWRKERRIEEAKRLLLEDRHTSSLFIAESVGIGDKSNFRRQFKEVAGCTPAEWRLKH